MGALVDVAGIVRSFQYAAEAGLRDHAERNLVPPSTSGCRWRAGARRGAPGSRSGSSPATSTRPRGESFVPADPDDRHALLTAYVLDKALYEVRYDLDHRPDWAPIPLRGIVTLLEGMP